MSLGRNIVILFCVAAVSRHVESGKIIAVPMPGAPSHIFIQWKVCKELIARHHEVLMVLDEVDVGTLRRVDTNGEIPYVTYDTGVPPSWWREELFKSRFGDATLGIVRTMLQLSRQADSLLSNVTTIGQLKEFHADLVLADISYIAGLWVSEVLDLPNVKLSNLPIYEPYHAATIGFPTVLAYNPMDGHGLAPPMAYWDRVRNTVHYVIISATFEYLWRNVWKPVGDKHGLRIRRPASLNMFNVDWALEWPRAVPPNVRLIGPLMPEPGRTLPPELDEFVSGSKTAGTVYASMGTFYSLEEDEFLEIGKALAALAPSRVVWKVNDVDLPKGMNMSSLHRWDTVKVVQWVPQNDLLAHKDVLAFLTHGGVNGLYEAAYHGVSIAAMPIHFDQLDNAAKAERQGWGLRVPLVSGRVSAEEIHKALYRLLHEPAFTDAARRVSIRLRSRKNTPAQEATDLLEHVMETNGSYYWVSKQYRLPWYTLYNLDVAALFFLPVAAIVLGVGQCLMPSRKSSKVKAA